MLRTLRRDIRAVFDRDPAARTTLEILLCYPGLHAIWGHRLSHWLWTHGFRLWARYVSHAVRRSTGIEIHPAAQIGPGFFIDHGMGAVIGETTLIGADVTLYQGATLGGTSLAKAKRHPTLQDRVVVGARAKSLGPVTIGEGSRIGANAVVVRSVPANAVVVGVPGQIVERSPRSTEPVPAQSTLPDVVGASLDSLMSRVDALERRVAGREPAVPSPHAPVQGVWRGEDFSI
jgi:serine O-acetyltransferase